MGIGQPIQERAPLSHTARGADSGTSIPGTSGVIRNQLTAVTVNSCLFMTFHGSKNHHRQHDNKLAKSMREGDESLIENTRRLGNWTQWSCPLAPHRGDSVAKSPGCHAKLQFSPGLVGLTLSCCWPGRSSSMVHLLDAIGAGSMPHRSW